MSENTSAVAHTTSKKSAITRYEQASGPIDYGFTNDYMFRAVLQSNQKVLTGLVSSLLHLQPKEITTIEITNPIELGASIDAKDFILDIHVEINHHTRVNLEMQVLNLLNWEDRSLSYLCRSYDQLYRGQDYSMALPVIHIGFLNYAPYEGSTEFYATYKLTNQKNGRIYSDKFHLRVVDLTHIEQATEEDKQYQIDYWARLFKATTWEEIQTMATNNEYLREASQALFVMNADEITRQKCLAREDYMRLQNSINKKLADLEQTVAEKDAENALLKTQIAALQKQLQNT